MPEQGMTRASLWNDKRRKAEEAGRVKKKGNRLAISTGLDKWTRNSDKVAKNGSNYNDNSVINSCWGCAWPPGHTASHPTHRRASDATPLTKIFVWEWVKEKFCIPRVKSKTNEWVDHQAACDATLMTRWQVNERRFPGARHLYSRARF